MIKINSLDFLTKNKIKFKDEDLLRKSLTHKSFDNINNNEKLEFLGDRVLGLIISKQLIEMYPDEKEGALDKKFANLVNKKTCYQIAKKLSLKKYMYLGESYKNRNKSDEKIASDCLEALIGAIYIDNGFKITEKFVLVNWRQQIEKSIETYVDSKTKLQEFCLKKYKELPKYLTYSKTGPNHDPSFKVSVTIPNSKKVLGVGKSIKIAQQNAATKLLAILKINL